MLKKIASTILALGFLLAGSVVFAQTGERSVMPIFKPLPVVFPILELGGCDSKSACRVYCNAAANKDACYAYAQPHGLMTRDQVTLAKKLRAQVGPGGCRGEECKTYCQNSDHAQLCVEFARQNGFISKDDATMHLERMKLASTTRQLPPINVERKKSEQGSSVFFGILHFFGL